MKFDIVTKIPIGTQQSDKKTYEPDPKQPKQPKKGKK